VFLLDQYGYGDRVAAEPGDVVFDVGGCWGDTALYFAELVGPAGKVFTFEFDPENLAVMRRNLALNPDLASRIEVVESALWHTPGETLEFIEAGRMSQLSGNGEAVAPGRSVVTATLDGFVAESGIDRVDLVKMDVEGAELDVLAGGRVTLARHAPKLALAAYHKDDDLVTIPAALRALGAGYELYLDTFSPLEDETVLFARANISR
jgi:FkbM family methyltransferase